MIELGGIPFPSDAPSEKPGELIDRLLSAQGCRNKKNEQLALFDTAAQKHSDDVPVAVCEKPDTPYEANEPAAKYADTVVTDDCIFQAVLPVLCAVLKDPMPVSELAEVLHVAKGQLQQWLKQAVDAGCVTKLQKPVRYVVHE